MILTPKNYLKTINNSLEQSGFPFLCQPNRCQIYSMFVFLRQQAGALAETNAFPFLKRQIINQIEIYSSAK